MKKLLVLFILTILFVASNRQAHAIYDPTSLPNNKYGIHILFPDELNKAKELVNSSNGDWGYVTIPIQAGDKDIKEWQGFMDTCRSLHLIPIVRLATEGDYFDTSTWRKPTNDDVIDFANFLNSLTWPTKNRYIIVFNEVNRADEWQGQSDPNAYALLLSYAVTIFKSKNKDFFIISAGLDNAASSTGKTYNEYDYMNQMNQSVPGIFNQIDGFSSHAYPNPGFSKPPSVKTAQSIDSFSFEEDTIDPMANKDLPVFITETGWDQSTIPASTVGNYFKEAATSVWNDPRIIAITPFLLRSGPGPFQKFSFLDTDGHMNDAFKTWQMMPKTKGTPALTPYKKVLGDSQTDENLPVKDFTNANNDTQNKIAKKTIKWFLFGL